MNPLTHGDKIQVRLQPAGRWLDAVVWLASSNGRAISFQVDEGLPQPFAVDRRTCRQLVMANVVDDAHIEDFWGRMFEYRAGGPGPTPRPEDEPIVVEAEQAETLRTAARLGMGREPTEEEFEQVVTYVLIALEAERITGQESIESGLARNLLAGHCTIMFDPERDGEPFFKMTDAGRQHVEEMMRSRGINPDDFKRQES